MLSRKLIVTLLMAAVLLCAVTAASALPAVMSAISASCDLPEGYLVLEAGHLDEQEAWLTAHGYTVSGLEAEFTERGVQVQAWSKDLDVCIEITAVQDDDAARIQDIDALTSSERNTYRLGYLKNRTGQEQGYNWVSAEWKKTSQGRFLMLRYTRTASTGSYVGYARRTIKNGLTITIDYQVYGRKLKGTDNTALTKIMTSWTFSASYSGTSATTVTRPTGTDDGSGTATQRLAVTGEVSATVFETLPPSETSSGEFTVKGRGTAGLTVVGTLMRVSSLEPQHVETVIPRSGKFSLPVKLTTEGVWLMTATVYNGDVIVEEKVFNTTTYQKTLLIVNFDSELPTQLVGDTLTISGTTMGATTVQCMVSGAVTYSKQIKTNNSGKFNFKISTAEEGDYVITVVFSKKNYSTRRYQANVSRTLTAEDLRDRAVSDAIKPGYSVLMANLESYTGRTMTYNLYITEIAQAGDQWAVFTAMRSTKTKGYLNQVVVICDEDPGFEIGSQHKMYGTCAGTYLVQDSENGDHYYPCFNLLFWAN
ncbi:MAG: hypothetical protein IKP40_10090 [Clostridia bacterium]|nr:hypothetical protein [Clostridia bacterium]